MKILATIVITLLTTSLFWVLLIDRNLENVGSFYDIKWNSGSAWVCITYEPPDAHPEMYFDWHTFTVRTKIICHGEKMEPLTN